MILAIPFHFSSSSSFFFLKLVKTTKLILWHAMNHHSCLEKHQSDMPWTNYPTQFSVMVSLSSKFYHFFCRFLHLSIISKQFSLSTINLFIFEKVLGRSSKHLHIWFHLCHYISCFLSWLFIPLFWFQAWLSNYLRHHSHLWASISMCVSVCVEVGAQFNTDQKCHPTKIWKLPLQNFTKQISCRTLPLFQTAVRTVGKNWK